MRKIKNLISWILNFGIKETLTEKTKKRVRIANILSLFVIFLVIPLYFVFNNIGADLLKLMILVVIMLQISILLLNKTGYINLSRFIAPNINALIIFTYSTSLGPETLYFLFYFPAISGSFLYFELKEKKFFVFQLTFSSILIYLDLFVKVKPFPPFPLLHETAVLVSYFMVPAGFLLFLVCLFALASESELAEKSLIKSREKAESATAAKSNFLARMSHEIRTPMNAVIGLTHLALETELSVKQEDYLKKIRRSSKSLLTIINDILDFSKIEAGKLGIENTKFNLQTVLDNLYSTLSLKASEKGMEILFVLDEKIPDLLEGDPLRLGQVLLNLTDNAVKFSNRGSVIVSTELVKQTQNNFTIRFSVRDEGIGMTPEQISNLFKSFHQVDGSITRRFGGTGLGLAISKQLVELMKGRLGVESTLGKGTKFFFELPFNFVKKISDQASNGVLQKNLHGAKILIVEDNPLNLQVISELIEQRGLKYDFAVNGRDGYRLACKNSYDMVLMDIQMPEMDGLNAAKKIRAYGLKNLPIIAMTAHAMESDREKSLQAGMNDHLTKPIDPEELNKVLLQYIKLDNRNIENNKNSTIKTNDSIKYELPNIEGLDVHKGLERIGGSEKLYIKLLKEYVKLYKNAEESLKTMIEDNEIGKATHLAHSLKGASSTIGIHSIFIIASNCEQYLLDESKVKVLEYLLNNKSLLTKIIDDIKNYFFELDDPINSAPENDQAEKIDLFKINQIIKKFLELSAKKDSEALDVAEKLQSMLCETEYSNRVSEILGLVEDVEFLEATELAKKVLADIEV